jgi:hypothetical protein
VSVAIKPFENRVNADRDLQKKVEAVRKMLKMKIDSAEEPGNCSEALRICI